MRNIVMRIWNNSLPADAGADLPASAPNTTLDTTSGPSVPIGHAQLVRLADEVWRLNRRIERAREHVADSDFRGVLDSAARLQTVLADWRVTIADHTGERYHEGMRAAVLHVEGAVDDDHEVWIADTIRPTVLLDDRVIRESQVTLATRPHGESRQ
jgi:hypothetical protein